MDNAVNVRLRSITEASDLTKLNDQLTEVMKRQQIQALIRNENLGKIADVIVDLASNPSDEIYAAAILGRLAAVARGREKEVYFRASKLFSGEPLSIESLADGDAKEYATKVIAYSKASWLSQYCAREALVIDAASNARKELLRILLKENGSIAESVRQLTKANFVLKEIKQVDTRIKRVRRVFEGLADVVRNYEGDVGQEPGSALANLVDAFMRGSSNSEVSAVYAGLDAVIGVLVRVIELRFSHALHAETYLLLQKGKRLVAQGRWARFLENSAMIHKVQVNLLETSLVLARQNRTDKEILRAMEASWPSNAAITDAIKHHFKDAVDIEQEVADYWLKVGRVSQSERAVEHKLGNTEDQQIGELLIQLEANRSVMGKLNSAVVPVLKIFDPYQAATVKRAATGYESIAQVAERLARMRRLSKTDLLGSIIEYNPIEHDMEGGHRSGIRRAKVVRDGILKEFNGKKKTLVKPRVEPEE